ncbi:unnamed protein product [Ostreobium quekettii]|uniref:Uncharacterized protein n=1 Tax=Ostreobium quekettii TaxID=121088 RepID=A0A8S1J9E7_9CHLO|nr:unnamed protein product [Ostreobium quekettii]|eukprot:evm.model.scf_3074.3 EVM.evm.TU.scf_3074.3   scf_3074:12424-13881(+)
MYSDWESVDKRLVPCNKATWWTGIYGPGRSVLSAAQTKALSPGQRRRRMQKYTNRCHVYDVCQVLLSSMSGNGSPGGVYNIVDDDPAPRADVEKYAAILMSQKVNHPSQHATHNLLIPPTRRWGVAASPNSREQKEAGLEEKRVKNWKLKSELGVRLEYPTYREGLEAIWRGTTRPFDAVA